MLKSFFEKSVSVSDRRPGVVVPSDWLPKWQSTKLSPCAWCVRVEMASRCRNASLLLSKTRVLAPTASSLRHSNTDRDGKNGGIRNIAWSKQTSDLCLVWIGRLFHNYVKYEMVFDRQTECNNNITQKHIVKYAKRIHGMYRLKWWLARKVYIQIQMATKTRDPGYSAGKGNTILDVNISLNTHFRH